MTFEDATLIRRVDLIEVLGVEARLIGHGVSLHSQPGYKIIVCGRRVVDASTGGRAYRGLNNSDTCPHSGLDESSGEPSMSRRQCLERALRDQGARLVGRTEHAVGQRAQPMHDARHSPWTLPAAKDATRSGSPSKAGRLRPWTSPTSPSEKARSIAQPSRCFDVNWMVCGHRHGRDRRGHEI